MTQHDTRDESISTACPMKMAHNLPMLRQLLEPARQAGRCIGLVPTMGNLHAGHLSLVEQARREADFVVVSIFVNPTQFGPGEDFDAYPRTLDQDLDQLRQAQVDLVFVPDVATMYPLGENRTWVHVDGLDATLCGASRPGHFRGVATVVSKLFHAVQPALAVFGEKDWQQLAIIRRMTQELLLPVRVVGAPISREPDGLARSSRNSYLTPGERQRAPLLQQALQRASRAIQEGERDYPRLEARMRQVLGDSGFRVDYFSIVQADTLVAAEAADRELLIAAAAWLGKPRLIDNIRISLA